MISSTYPLGFGGAYEPKNSTTPSEIFLRRSSVSRPELCLDFTASSLRTIPVTDTASAGSHFGGEAIQLVHHRVDRVLELEDLAFRLGRDLLRQVASGDRRRHLG